MKTGYRYNRLDKNDVAVLLVDHQTGLANLVHDFTPDEFRNNVLALAESAFDPLSRTTRFMLTEEAHHLFVGETGVGRTIEATCAAMNSTSASFRGCGNRCLRLHG